MTTTTKYINISVTQEIASFVYACTLLVIFFSVLIVEIIRPVWNTTKRLGLYLARKYGEASVTPQSNSPPPLFLTTRFRYRCHKCGRPIYFGRVVELEILFLVFSTNKLTKFTLSVPTKTISSAPRTIDSRNVARCPLINRTTPTPVNYIDPKAHLPIDWTNSESGFIVCSTALFVCLFTGVLLLLFRTRQEAQPNKKVAQTPRSVPVLNLTRFTPNPISLLNTISARDNLCPGFIQRRILGFETVSHLNRFSLTLTAVILPQVAASATWPLESLSNVYYIILASDPSSHSSVISVLPRTISLNSSIDSAALIPQSQGRPPVLEVRTPTTTCTPDSYHKPDRTFSGFSDESDSLLDDSIFLHVQTLREDRYHDREKIKSSRKYFKQCETFKRYPRGKLSPCIPVLLIDSGIMPTHRELKQRCDEEKRILPWGDYTKDPADPRNPQHPEIKKNSLIDEYGHGTCNAYIIGSLADFAYVYSAKISQYGKPGEECLARLVQILNDAADNLAKFHIIAMPISFQKSNDPDADAKKYRPLLDAITRLSNQGTILVAAAGNSGDNESLCYPAAFPQVIAVYSTCGNGKDSQFSPSPQKKNGTEFYVPGEGIRSPYIRRKKQEGEGSDDDDDDDSDATQVPRRNQVSGKGKDSDERYTYKSGTSFACAVLVGLIAALEQKLYAQEPQSTDKEKAYAEEKVKALRLGITDVLRQMQTQTETDRKPYVHPKNWKREIFRNRF